MGVARVALAGHDVVAPVVPNGVGHAVVTVDVDAVRLTGLAELHQRHVILDFILTLVSFSSIGVVRQWFTP